MAAELVIGKRPGEVAVLEQGEVLAALGGLPKESDRGICETAALGGLAGRLQPSDSRPAEGGWATVGGPQHWQSQRHG